MQPDARIGFAGTPEFAREVLAGLISGGYRPCVVYSQPDRARGRGRKLVPSPVKALAMANEIPVETPRSLRQEETQAQFRAHQLDLFIVAAYGLILPQPILDAPRLGCLNVHASLLPRWRGAAPIERAIMAGDQETGVALMQMEAGLDTGPVYRSARVAISAHTTGGALEVALAQLGTRLLLELLPELEQHSPLAQPDTGASYADKLTPADSSIDWAQPAAQIHRQVRALRDRAPARTSIGEVVLQVLEAEPLADTVQSPPGTILALAKQGLRVATADGVLNITRAQLNRGKGKPLAAADLANGYSDLLPIGERLGAPRPAA